MIYLADSDWHRRAVRLLTVLLAAAIAVSVIHYVDNYVNYADFPSDGPLPDPSRALVGASWFAFTAAGVVGYILFRRGPSTLALSLLAVYSGSGLVGFGHYTVPGAFDMPALRQAHVIADILLGLGMFGFVIWAARHRTLSAARAPTPQSG
ncbi:MAG: hypothetical protein ACJ762_14105 [Solirubrobacteraceae bacterium]